MDRRVHKINLKISVNEREELNKIILEQGLSLSDVIRVAVKNYWKTEGFYASFEEIAMNQYSNRKWELY